MALITNASIACITPTDVNSLGTAIHPTVIDFLIEHKMESWGGYRYWMAMTPWPNSNDGYEYPNVLGSNDGQTWEIPSGIINPIETNAQYGTSGTGMFQPDPDILYDPDENCIRVYWQASNGDANTVGTWLKKIYSNHSIGEKIRVVTGTIDQDGTGYISCATVRESANKWHQWVVRPFDAGAGNNSKIYYRFSTSGDSFSDGVECNTEILSKYSRYPWHISAKYNKWEERFEFLINDLQNSNYGLIKIFYGQAVLDNPTNINCPLNDYAIEPSLSGWDKGLYRATFVIERGENNYVYHVWYSGLDTQWHVGKTSGQLGVEFTTREIIGRSNGQDIKRPVYNPVEVNLSWLRTETNNGIKAFKLVDATDELATNLRIFTSEGIKSIANY